MGRYYGERTDAETKCVGMELLLYVPRTGASANPRGATPLATLTLVYDKTIQQRIILIERDG